MSKSERAHYTRMPAAWVAGCSDVGLRHSSNQDALCIAVRDMADDRTALIAVADGVSTAAGSEIASSVAVEYCVSALQDRLAQGLPENVAFVQAFSEAHRHVLEAAVAGEPSACTLIAAYVRTGSVSIANIGDSRAYWMSDDGTCTLLSTDDSMAQARILLGMPREEAEQSTQAHAITKWLGRNANDVSPTIREFVPRTTGWLLLCSDGLWNYASSPEAMGALVQQTLGEHPIPRDATEAMVAWAIEQGGRDNITVTLARVEPSR